MSSTGRCCGVCQLQAQYLESAGARTFGKFRYFFFEFQKSNMVPLAHFIEHSWWSLAWYTVNKPINIPVVKCINIHTKWDNKDYK